jgi:hypothetical protein
MGLRAFLVVLAACALCVGAALPEPADGGLKQGKRYLRAQQRANGGFGEPGRAAEVGLTGWVVIGLKAARSSPERPGRAASFLSGRSDPAVTDLELRLLALDALGRNVSTLANRVAGHRRGNGRIGPTINSTIWGIIALRAAGRSVPGVTVRWLRGRQAGSGGWSWYGGGQPDSNDTAAAVQALRAAGVSKNSATIRRACRFIRRHQNPNGGFELTLGRGSDAPSTAWAIQGLIAAGRKPGERAFAYLRRLQRGNGSFRYSARFVSNPVWTTAQVVAALARRPFPAS